MESRNYILCLLIVFSNMQSIQISTVHSTNTQNRLDWLGINAGECKLDTWNSSLKQSSADISRLSFRCNDNSNKSRELPSKRLKRTSDMVANGHMISGENYNSSLLNPEIEFLSSEDDEISLGRLLTTIVFRNLKECDLMIIVDESFLQSQILETLISYPNLKQVMVLTPSVGDTVHQMSWTSSRCQGVLILVTDPQPFIDFGNLWANAWDYKAKVIIAGLARRHLEIFIRSLKAKKTEQIIAIVKNNQVGSFTVLANELFWGNRSFSHATTWEENAFTLDANLFPDKISNLRLADIIVIGFELKPFIMKHRLPNGQVLRRYGREVEVYRTLSEAFNFTIVEQEPDPRELFGIPLPNGSYTGMFGILERAEGDLAVEDIYAKLDRASAMDFSTPYSVDQGCFLARIEPPLSPWESPALPFQKLTWIVIFIGMILAGPSLYLMARDNRQSNTEKQRQLSLVLSSLYAYGIHFSQPMASLPERSSTRISVAFLWIYSIILTTGYKSNLTAFLTITREPKSIETTYELYKSGRKVMGFDTFRYGFEMSEIYYINKLSKRYDATFIFDEPRKDDVLKGNSVLIHSVKYLSFLIAQLSSSSRRPTFRVMKECMPQYSIVVAFQKNSPLKQKFDQVITRMFEAGLPRKWFIDSIDMHRQIQRQNAGISKSEVEHSQEGVVPLGLDHMQGVFIVWCLASIISTAVFIVEMLFTKRPLRQKMEENIVST